MSTNEDLYRQMVDEEEEMSAIAAKARVQRSAVLPPVRSLPNEHEARNKFSKGLKPFIEACRRVEAGLAPTTNPLKNLMHMARGTFRRKEAPIADATKGIEIIGKSEDEVRQEIIANPDAFKELSKPAPKVGQVPAARKTPQDLRGDR